jgi:hypothetical protein
MTRVCRRRVRTHFCGHDWFPGHHPPNVTILATSAAAGQNAVAPRSDTWLQSRCSPVPSHDDVPVRQQRSRSGQHVPRLPLRTAGAASGRLPTSSTSGNCSMRTLFRLTAALCIALRAICSSDRHAAAAGQEALAFRSDRPRWRAAGRCRATARPPRQACRGRHCRCARAAPVFSSSLAVPAWLLTTSIISAAQRRCLSSTPMLDHTVDCVDANERCRA